MDADRIDDAMLPGFRFHPTDEELVGFYLKRKIQQLPLPIELIKHVDIYKYDPWDLPRLAATGEKEWYFYCPRDRKYRNSTRPNRVTGAGFWKATGTDRPIYSSDGTKCIGLKKSLVFYRGRAAKGIKTDWMMHEFRLPSAPDTTAQPKNPLDKNFPAADAWAICRIFKKTNSIAQRALSHAWVTPFPETGSPDMFCSGAVYAQLHSDTTQTGSSIHLYNNVNQQQASTDNFSAFNNPSFKSINAMTCKPSSFGSSVGDIPSNFMFSGPEISGTESKCSIDVSSMIFNDLTGDISKTSVSSIDFDGPQQQLNDFYTNPSQEMQRTEGHGGSLNKNQSTDHVHDDQWPNIISIGFPFSLPSNLPDAWKTNLTWESPPCPSEISTTYSTNNA